MKRTPEPQGTQQGTSPQGTQPQLPQPKKYFSVLVALPVSDLNRSGQYLIPSNWQRGELPAPARLGFNPYVQLSRVIAATAGEAGEAAARLLFWRLRREGDNLLLGYFGTWQVLVRVEDGGAGASSGGGSGAIPPESTSKPEAVLHSYLYGISGGTSVGASAGASVGASAGTSVGASAGVSGGASVGTSAGTSVGTSADEASFDLVAKPSGLYHKTPTSLRLLMSAYADPGSNLSVSMSAHLPLSQPKKQRVGAGTGTAGRSAQTRTTGRPTQTRTAKQQKTAGQQPRSGAGGGGSGGARPHRPHREEPLAPYRQKERARNIKALGLSGDVSWEEELAALEALTEKRRRELRLSPQTNYAVENRIEARRRLRRLHGEGGGESTGSSAQKFDEEVRRVDEERRAESKRAQARVEQERRVARGQAEASERDRKRMLGCGAYIFFAIGLALLISVYESCDTIYGS